MKAFALDIMEHIRQKLRREEDLQSWNYVLMFFALVYIYMSRSNPDPQYVYYFEDRVHVATALIACFLTLIGLAFPTLFTGVLYTNYHFKPRHDTWYKVKKTLVIFGILFFVIARIGVDMYNQLVWFIAIYDPTILPTLYIDPMIEAFVIIVSIGYSQFYLLSLSKTR